MTNYWKVVNQVITNADVLLLLLDARFVEDTRNWEIEEKVKRSNKPIIFVITKSDLIDKTIAEKYKKTLNPCVFVSSKDHHGITMLRERIFIEAKRAGFKGKEAVVGVLGYPNVGKSSLINAMKGKNAAPTSAESGHTKGLQKIKIGKKVLFLDTPGVIPYGEKDYLMHSMMGVIDFNKTRNPDMVAMELMETFPGKIESFYGVKAQEDKEETINEIAVKQHILKKGAKPDSERMARTILKDWQKGVIK